jgi:hypothetical protein
VYTNVTGTTPTSGTPAGTAITGTMALAGYHTVPLSSLVQLTAGQKFSVVVQLTTPGTNSPIPIQYAKANYSSKATGTPGRSFQSGDGNAWEDVTKDDATATVCLKAFTSANSAQGSYPLIVNSVSPPSGVAIRVNPLDNSGMSDGTTSFTRTYNAGAGPILLTAQNAAGGVAFNAWTGCDSSTGLTCTINSMNAGKMVTANYLANNKTVSTNSGPVIDSLSPATVKAGASAFTLTVNGSGFGDTPGAGVIWSGADRTASTTWVSDSQVLVSVAPTDITTEGPVNVAVTNPGPGGGTSAAVELEVDTAGNSVAVSSSQETTLVLIPGESIDLPVTLAGVNSGAQISLTCLNLPAGGTCTYSNGTLTIATTADTPSGNYSVVAAFTITQQVTTARNGHGGVFLAAWTGMAAFPIGLLWIGGGRKQRSVRCGLVLVALLLIMSLGGCGGSSGQTTTTQSTKTVTTRSSLPITLYVVDF